MTACRFNPWSSFGVFVVFIVSSVSVGVAALLRWAYSCRLFDVVNTLKNAAPGHAPRAALVSDSALLGFLELFQNSGLAFKNIPQRSDGPHRRPIEYDRVTTPPLFALFVRVEQWDELMRE
jgi:hypothetical protein